MCIYSQTKLQPQCKMFLPSLNHSFFHSVYCADVTQRSRHIPAHFYSAIYSRRANQKLWTSSRETRPKHPEEPFCLTFIHSCSFSRVPPESIWQTLVKKKDFEERKTTSRSWTTHTPSAVVLSSFIIYTLCALIWFLQFGLVVIVAVLVFFCFVCGALRYETERGGGGEFSPVCI